MKILTTTIDGVFTVETRGIVDSRGSFARLFCERELAPLLEDRHIVQINHSLTRKIGAVRGLHYQHAPHAEMKMVRCLKGKVWDVAVDLRQNSSTFLQWYAQELTPANARMMVIPEGCAHGFQVLEPEGELLYLHTAFYTAESEDGVRFDDPALGIEWPMDVTNMSEKDRSHPLISDSFDGVKT